ncbi:guanylate cyclase soluble subunit beta-2-like isoform X1 [Physella acuta]|uniref:guanylate cyclase soluble subunit beta-2-like isoform X1 n=1 Tax=Physella acuta TaxID=109671 RepID=UPI0027DC336B|nr:guanylate cyclase soluble subunit beta-2-like isoform X1 [Physella acuta]XP_059144681.1 guanylate cyclase soluble subunit beta-2-like isoform X1 [Physella acuta]
MYGHIHCVIKDLVTSKFGQEMWEMILKDAGMEEREHLMLFYHYDDAMTFTLVASASKCLNLPAETVLEVFGDYFLVHCLRYGYDDMLRTLGSDITSFIQNLDSLHSLLALTYDKIVAPSFRCENNPDDSLTLHYYSTRTGLHPLVRGVVRAVAREIFEQEVDITLLSRQMEQLDAERTQEHSVFRVVILKSKEVREEPEGLEHECREVEGFNESQLAPVVLTKTQFISTFPYHLIFDENLRLCQYGVSVGKLSPIPLREGMLMTSAFRVVYPRMTFSVQNIKRFINTIFVIAIEASHQSDDENFFSMKGQMIWMESNKLMIFIGSPRLTSLKEMKRMNVYMADIPLYDVTREMVLLYQQRNAEIDITKKLDETTAELKRTSKELEFEKQKTDRLLYQMLPEKVAIQLKNGQKVEAEKFDQVTILFSDIVTFTNIAAACSPLDVVNMLNDMYHRFDLKTTVHGVYKVETIGDAYMVVSGVPEKTDVHAQPVANFALDMVEQAACVLSPATGKPLQIRVGLHSGPVVAGVVGLKMPRYCLFGDTVNTASRMESHGIPGRIHLSPTTYKALEGEGYLCKARGQTEIKGKGIMQTYFLIGNSSHVISEPQDEYTGLPFLTEEQGKGGQQQTTNGADDTSKAATNDVTTKTKLVTFSAETDLDPQHPPTSDLSVTSVQSPTVTLQDVSARIPRDSSHGCCFNQSDTCSVSSELGQQNSRTCQIL